MDKKRKSNEHARIVKLRVHILHYLFYVRLGQHFLTFTVCISTSLYCIGDSGCRVLIRIFPWNPRCVWNVMAYTQKPDLVFRRNGRIHLNRQGRQFSRLLAAEVCASAVVMVVMLDTPRFKVVWRVLATHSIRQFPLHFPSRALPYTITFQPESSTTFTV